MTTPMDTEGPEPRPTDVTPYPYPTTSTTPMPRPGQTVDWWEASDLTEDAVKDGQVFIGVTATGASPTSLDPTGLQHVDGMVVPQYVFRDNKSNRHYLVPVAETVIAWKAEESS